MKYSFVIEFDCEEKPTTGQIGVPVMNALKLDKINVVAAAELATMQAAVDAARKLRAIKEILRYGIRDDYLAVTSLMQEGAKELMGIDSALAAHDALESEQE